MVFHLKEVALEGELDPKALSKLNGQVGHGRKEGNVDPVNQPLRSDEHGQSSGYGPLWRSSAVFPSSRLSKGMMDTDSYLVVREGRAEGTVHDVDDRPVSVATYCSAPGELDLAIPVMCIERDAERPRAFFQLDVGDLGRDCVPVRVTYGNVKTTHYLELTQLHISDVSAVQPCRQWASPDRGDPARRLVAPIPDLVQTELVSRLTHACIPWSSTYGYRPKNTLRAAWLPSRYRQSAPG